MDEHIKNIIADGVKMISPELERITDMLCLFYEQIELFNATYKLVGAGSEELAIRHILDCLAPYSVFVQYAAAFDESASFADLGSGAGLPGLVLAAALNRRFTLVERMARRAGFLRSCAAQCKIPSLVNVCEKNLCEVKQQFDFVTMRAFRPLKDIGSDLVRILKPCARVFIYKSSEENIESEIRTVREELNGKFEYESVSYNAPFQNAKRSLLILHRI